MAGDDEEALPSVWFHTSKPACTVCLQALAVGPDGKCLVPAAAVLAQTVTIGVMLAILIPIALTGRFVTSACRSRPS